MRILLYIPVLMLFLSSCQMREARIVTTKHQPFLELKNGTMIHTYKIEWNYDGFQKEFLVNRQIIPAHDVAFYSDGVNSFANVNRKHFAEMISEGKINVYKTQHLQKLTGKKTGYAAGPYLRKNSIFDHYYIQNTQFLHKRTIVKLTYKNLEPLIPGDAVAWNYLRQYRRQRNFTTKTTFIGAGILIGGLVIADTKFGKKSPGIGLGMQAAGAGITLISVGVKIPHAVKLYRVVKFYN